MNLRDYFGAIDIYLFDQLLKDRFDPSMRILDAGCGTGRNLIYFLRQGYSVFGIDADPAAVAQMQHLAREIAPAVPEEAFTVSEISEMSFLDAFFDVVICSAVLHFARDEAHFEGMVANLWRVLKPGGLFFARLASTIGIEGKITPVQGRWYALPDGTQRFLVDEALLVQATKEMGGRWLEPLKTTNVQNKRAMTTWVLRK